MRRLGGQKKALKIALVGFASLPWCISLKRTTEAK
jgi:hypothetical protein